MLIVDDERTFKRHTHTFYARTKDEAKDMLVRSYSPRISEVSLDHDLGPDGDVRPLVRWMQENWADGALFKLKAVYVHTMNPVGADWIVGMLQPYFPVVRRISLYQLGESLTGL